jgi:hypothetical protein
LVSRSTPLSFIGVTSVAKSCASRGDPRFEKIVASLAPKSTEKQRAATSASHL